MFLMISAATTLRTLKYLHTAKRRVTGVLKVENMMVGTMEVNKEVMVMGIAKGMEEDIAGMMEDMATAVDGTTAHLLGVA